MMITTMMMMMMIMMTMVSDDADINPESIEVDDDDEDDEDDDDDDNAAMSLFKSEDVQNGQLDVENVGKEEEYNLVLTISESSWLTLWAMFGLFCIINACFFWCYYKKNNNVQINDDQM